MKGPEAVTVDLGLIGKYSKYPHGSTTGCAIPRHLRSDFGLPWPSTDVSLIQLGYRMQIGTRSIRLIDFSRAPASGQATRFPTQPIRVEIRRGDWTIYDVYQSTIFTAAEEDTLRAETPSYPQRSSNRRALCSPPNSTPRASCQCTDSS